MASRAPTAKWKRRRGRREPEVGMWGRIIAATNALVRDNADDAEYDSP
jgi:hypothetical protein